MGDARPDAATASIDLNVTDKVATLLDRELAAIAAEELRDASPPRLPHAFRNAQTPLAMIDHELRFVEVNWIFEQSTGRTKEEAGDVDSNYVHPADRQAAMEAAIRTLTGEIDAFKLEKRVFHKDGHIIWVLESTTLVRDESGRPLHFLAQFIDISDRKA